MFRRPPRCLLNFRVSTRKEYKRSFRILGIETSCDDACVAVVDIPTCGPPIIRHNVVRRSLELSEPYGGIVPLFVGKFHNRELAKVLCEVRDSKGFVDLDLIAVTRGIFVLGER